MSDETTTPAAAAGPAPEAEKPLWERDAVVPEWVDAGADPLAVALGERFGAALLKARSFAGELTLELAPEAVAEVGRNLHDEHGYKLLLDVCGAHYPKREPQFEVVYHLHAMPGHRRIRLKVAVGEGAEVPSVCGVWPAANWSEREVYDMYGVRFSGHPDLTRILLWDGFNGYPLRKDFPVEGIDTGAAIYPERYDEGAGPVAGSGTGWKVPKPPASEGGAP